MPICSKHCRYFDAHTAKGSVADCRAISHLPVMQGRTPEPEERNAKRFEMAFPGPLQDIVVPGFGIVSVSRGHETRGGQECPYRGPYAYPKQIEPDHITYTAQPHGDGYE